MIVGISESEMRASDKAGAEGQEEEGAGEKEGFCGGPTGEGSEVRRRGVVTPVGLRGVESYWIVGERLGHGFAVDEVIFFPLAGVREDGLRGGSGRLLRAAWD